MVEAGTSVDFQQPQTPHEKSSLPFLSECFDKEMDRRVDLHLCDLDCKIIGWGLKEMLENGEWRIDDGDDDDGDAKDFHFVVKTMRSFQLCMVFLGNAVQTSPSLHVKGWFYMYRALPIAAIVVACVSINTVLFNQYWNTICDSYSLYSYLPRKPSSPYVARA